MKTSLNNVSPDAIITYDKINLADVVVVQFLSGMVPLAEMARFTPFLLQLLALRLSTCLDSGHPPSSNQSSLSPPLLASSRFSLIILAFYRHSLQKPEQPSRKFLFKTTGKHLERIINHCKGNASLMMARTASGYSFSPHIAYKSQNLWTPLMENGQKNASYNTSKSGWSDATCFADPFFL